MCKTNIRIWGNFHNNHFGYCHHQIAEIAKLFHQASTSFTQVHIHQTITQNLQLTIRQRQASSSSH